MMEIDESAQRGPVMETEEIVLGIRQWAIDKVQEYNSEGIDRIYDQMAIMDEFDEWFDPKLDIEVVTLDEITEEEYDNYVDGIERA